MSINKPIEEDLISPRVIEAINFSIVKHNRQVRNNPLIDVPYIVHPLEVMSVVCKVYGSTKEDLLMGAVLHDTIEDTDTTYRDLFFKFNERVADIVWRLTETIEYPDGKKIPYLDRKNLYLQSIKNAPADIKEEVFAIAMADKYSNMSDWVRDNSIGIYYPHSGDAYMKLKVYSHLNSLFLQGSYTSSLKALYKMFNISYLKAKEVWVKALNAKDSARVEKNQSKWIVTP